VASGLSIGDLQRIVEEKLASFEKLAARRAALVAELDAVDAELTASGAGGGRRRGRKPGPKPGRKAGRRGPGRPPKNGRRRRGPGRPPKAGKRRGPGRPPKGGKRRGRKAGPPGQGPLHNMIRNAMKGASEPMKLAEIADKVVAGGYKSKSPRFPMIVGQRLAEMKDVKKAGRGLYAMK
jgi:hypothetical protein